MNSFLKKASIGILTYIAILLTEAPFLTVYHLGHQNELFLYAFLICLLSILVPRIRYNLLFYGIGWLGILYRFFPYGENFSLAWFTRFFSDLQKATSEILSGKTGYITEIVAVTIIVTAILLVAVFSIYIQRFFLIYSAMGIYLLTVAIFNDFDLKWHVLGICFCGILCGLIKTQHPRTFREWGFWIGFLCLGLLLLVGASFLPRTALRDQLVTATTGIRTQFNQLGFYQFIEDHGAPNSSRTGFSENDRQLGGPLLDDNTVLFTAQQNQGHYWRVESKDFYSGKGWINTFHEEELQNEAGGLTVKDSSYRQSYLETENIQLTLQNQGDYLPLPYGSSYVTIEEGAGGFIIDETVQRVDFINPQPEIRASLTWQPSDYVAESLQQLSLQQPDAAVDYTQLPETLPERIYELARTITEDQGTMFAQVTAIENYLKNSVEFRYSKTDAVYPEDEQDYVDQFLFESKVGYCDNFSTAMVVLLRTLDIPTRWAKGFSPGDPSTENGLTTYTVRNRNAHSWVEVYFAGFGWVPFEPTPNFQNPDRPELQAAASSSEELPNTSSSSQENTESRSSSETSQSSTSESVETSSEEATTSSDRQQWVPYLQGAALVALVGLLYLLRRYFFRIRIWFIYHFHSDPLPKAYPVLMKQLAKVLFHNDSESLQAYAHRLEDIYPIFHGDFIKLTESYESYLYGHHTIVVEKQQILAVAEQISHLKKINQVR
jgi:transglutaminase-like putative cysteine protease